MSKRWAFKQTPGGVEVWRYMDSIEEVRDYPYVMDAINKYGEKDVLPILMNSLGGYHTAPLDKIIEIVECNTRPDFSHPQLQRHLINTPDFCCGWISPEGVTYSCHHYGHLDLAEELCRGFNLKWGFTSLECKHWYYAPDEVLMQNGWIKIDASRNHYCFWDKVTDKACAKLDELDKKWGRKL